jgi:hypothetical protein
MKVPLYNRLIDIIISIFLVNLYKILGIRISR